MTMVAGTQRRRTTRARVTAVATVLVVVGLAGCGGGGSKTPAPSIDSTSSSSAAGSSSSSSSASSSTGTSGGAVDACKFDDATMSQTAGFPVAKAADQVPNQCKYSGPDGDGSVIIDVRTFASASEATADRDTFATQPISGVPDAFMDQPGNAILYRGNTRVAVVLRVAYDVGGDDEAAAATIAVVKLFA